MLKEQKNRRLFLHIMLVIVISISAILFFLFSIKGLLLSESKQRLVEINKQSIKISNEYDTALLFDMSGTSEVVTIPDSNHDYDWNNSAYSFLVNDHGNIVAMFGKTSMENLPYIELFLDEINLSDLKQAIYEDENQVKQYNLKSGESIYATILEASVASSGYVITIVSKQLVTKEINSVFHIAITIIILVFVALILAFIYYYYQQSSAIRKSNKSGKPDVVTGLPQYSIHKAIAQKYINAEKYTYAYVSFSIDKYTLIAELNGRSYCDYLLKGVAQIISNWIKEEETFARFQDDVFGMLLIYDDELKFRQRLIRILKHAGDIPMNENNFCKITFRSGVCIVGKETDIDRVIARAKKARLKVGDQTIANISFYQNKTAIVNESSQLIKEVSDAFYRNQFLVFFQPKYRIESEEIVGIEALVRWNHPKNGLLGPNVFLPLLESNGIITQIDIYVLESVCEHMREWINTGKSVVPVSINLSAQHLKGQSFLQDIVDIVDSYHIPHQLIEFEFPEIAVYENREELIKVMKSLSELGFILSVDNFGASYSSIHLLNELPIHALKIDKALIRDLEDVEFSDKDRTIVMHIISYAKSMKVEVVAEGVETKGQHDLLQEQKCDIIQGYYYQKPMPPEEFALLL